MNALTKAMASHERTFRQDATETMHLNRLRRYAARCAWRNEAEVRHKREATALMRVFIGDYVDLGHHEEIMQNRCMDVAARKAAMEQSKGIQDAIERTISEELRRREVSLRQWKKCMRA